MSTYTRSGRAYTSVTTVYSTSYSTMTLGTTVSVLAFTVALSTVTVGGPTTTTTVTQSPTTTVTQSDRSQEMIFWTAVTAIVGVPSAIVAVLKICTRWKKSRKVAPIKSRRDEASGDVVEKRNLDVYSFKCQDIRCFSLERGFSTRAERKEELWKEIEKHFAAVHYPLSRDPFGGNLKLRKAVENAVRRSVRIA